MSKPISDLAAVIDERIRSLEACAAECCKPGAVSCSGYGAERKEYVSDGVPRWHDRTTAKGLTLRWKRAAVNDAEALDLAAALERVPDDCDGWIVMEATK